MSTIRFTIEDWVQADDPDPRRAGTAAEFAIYVDDVPATRLFDTWSRTVTDRARLPLYPLAEWFAANWWRLHAEAPFEGGTAPPVTWRLAHDLTAVGGGFIWPRMRFASDDRVILVSARALRNAPWEPVRHLNDIQPARGIEVADFDRAVEGVVEAVLRRLGDLGVSAEPLATIWSDVLAEQADDEVAAWRRWEARLGYDPGQAPDDLMRRTETLLETVGRAAASEVVPLLGTRSPAVLGRLTELAAAPGVAAQLPVGDGGLSPSSGLPPWEAGRELARAMRERSGRLRGPIDDAVLSELLGIRARVLEELPRHDAPIGLGVRAPGDEHVRLHFRKRNPAGLRFEAARFLADSLSAASDDRWLPLTDRATARQKLQRAFAAEFLAPIEDIVEELDDDRSSDRFEDLGDRYGVSPLAIRSQLANHGLLTFDETRPEYT